MTRPVCAIWAAVLEASKNARIQRNPQERGCRFTHFRLSNPTMFSGIQEILVLAGIVGAIFLLPRLGGRSRPPAPVRRRVSSPLAGLAGGMRLAVSASLLWPLGAAVYLEPWQTGPRAFLLAGLLPVAALWGILWVTAGFRNKRR